MIAFGAFGFVMVALIAATVRPWFSETRHAAAVQSGHRRRSEPAQPQHRDPHDPEPHPRPQHVRFPGPLSHVSARNAALFASRCRESHRLFRDRRAGFDSLRLDRRSLFSEARSERIAALHRRARLSLFSAIAEHGDARNSDLHLRSHRAAPSCTSTSPAIT